MTEQANGFTETGDNAAVVYAANLLRHYSFELGGYTAEELLAHWGEQYPADWRRLAIIEALYQGRYKAVSVEQLLMFWQRRGQPLYHFNHEFERLVCNRLPRNLAPAPELPPNNPVSPVRSLEERSDQFLSTLKLLSEQRHPFADRDLSSGLQLPTFTQSLPGPGQGAKPEPEATSTVKEQLSQLQAWLKLEDTVPLEPVNGSHRVLAAIEQAHQQMAQDQTQDQPLAADNLEPSSPDAASLLAQTIVTLQASTETWLATWSKDSAALNPRLMLELIGLCPPQGLSASGDKAPIRQFTPAAEASDFYSKLKLVALPESAAAKAASPEECPVERSPE